MWKDALLPVLQNYAKRQDKKAGQKGRTKRQDKKAGQKGRTKRQDKKAGQKGRTKRQGKKAGQKGRTKRQDKKAGQKWHALARISTFLSLQQRKTIMNIFILSKFGYYPLIWMCHSRSLNSRINRIHEIALKIICNDNISSFEQLLEISGSVTIYVRNLQRLAAEIYKVLNTLSSSSFRIIPNKRHEV